MKKNIVILLVGFILVASIVGVIFKLKKNKESADAKNYNVVIVAFDALQAKHLSEYGYEKSTTPNLDKLIEKSYLFKKNVSPSSWTVPTFMSIFTGLFPSKHKVTNKFSEYTIEGTTTKAVKSNLKQLSPDVLTLAEILKKNGYVTGGFTGDAGVSAPFGFAQGFDEYYDKETFGGLSNSISQASAWLDKNKNNKFFMFLHGYDVHGQYAPKEGFDYRYVKKPYEGIYTGITKEQGELREMGLVKGDLPLFDEDVDFWRAIYDEKINRADEEFGRFMKQFDNLGLEKNTIIIALSDHGTEFYEHKRFDHGHTLYGELVDTLLSIHLPGQEKKTEINSLVSTLDVAPTILDLLNIKDNAVSKMDGISLKPSFAGQDVSRDIYCETDYRLFTHKRSVQTPNGLKFILTMENNERELYDLNKDPGEKNNILAQNIQVTYELEQKIYAHLKAMNSEGPWTIGCSPAYGDQCLPPKEAPVLKSSFEKLPNIVFINIDSLRADRMGIYGYQKNTTPFLDSMFRQGVVFENAITPGYLTFQTDAAIFSGLYPSQNNVTQWDTPINQKLELLPKVLGYYGYKSGAFVSPSLWETFGFSKQFNDYKINRDLKNVATSKNDVIKWMSENKNPFFIFWHVYDVHLPFVSPSGEFAQPGYKGNFFDKNIKYIWEGQSSKSIWEELPGQAINNQIGTKKVDFTSEDVEYLKASYDSGIKYVDSELQSFFAELKGKGLYDNTIFIISSEHGEDLKEHGFIFHRDIYDVNTRVPLAIIAPGLSPKVVKQAVSSLDIFPTLIEMIGGVAPVNIEGASLIPIINGSTTTRDIFTERAPFDDASIRRGEWKYIRRNPDKKKIMESLNNDYDWFMKRLGTNDVNYSDELYNLANDPGEQINLIGKGLPIENELKEAIIKFKKRMRTTKMYNMIKKVTPPGGVFIPYP